MAHGPVVWPAEIALSVMVHGIAIGLRKRDREPDYFSPPTCLDPIGPRKEDEQKARINDLRERGLTEKVDSFYMVGKRRYNTTTERVSLRRTAEPLLELVTSFKDAKPVAGVCKILETAVRRFPAIPLYFPPREWRERGRQKLWSETGGCWREFVPASTTPSLLRLLGISSPEMVPLRTWRLPLALPVKCSDLTIEVGAATYTRPGTETTPATKMVAIADHQAVSEWFALGVLSSEQPCETQTPGERVHVKRGQEWIELGAADDDAVEVDRSTKYTSSSAEYSRLTIDISGACTFQTRPVTVECSDLTIEVGAAHRPADFFALPADAPPGGTANRTRRHPHVHRSFPARLFYEARVRCSAQHP